MKLEKAIELLDVNKDDDWTAQGLPSLAAIKSFMGEDSKVTRQIISDTFPELTRESLLSTPDAAEDEGYIETQEAEAEVEVVKDIQYYANEIAKLNQKKSDIDIEIKKLEVEQSKVAEIEAAKPKECPFKRHHRRQAEIRAEKAQRLKQMQILAGNQLKPDLSPLDQAIANQSKNKRTF